MSIIITGYVISVGSDDSEYTTIRSSGFGYIAVLFKVSKRADLLGLD